MLHESSLYIEQFGKLRDNYRIAFVYGNRSEDSSLDQTTARLIQELQVRGHEISLIRTKIKSKELFSLGNVFEQTLVKESSLVSRALKMGAPAMATLTNLWSIRRPDIVFVCADGSLGWSAIKSARKLKIPSISDIRTHFISNNELNRNAGGKLFRGAVMAYLRKFHNSTQCTLVHSHEAKRQLSGLGFTNIEVVPTSVDTELFNPHKRSGILRKSWSADESTQVLIYFSEGKKDQYLTETVRFFKNNLSHLNSVKLIIISTSQNKLFDKKINNLFVLPRLDYIELSECLASTDLMLSPGSSDVNRVEIIEALASGIPVLFQTTNSNHLLLEDNVNSFVVQSDKFTDFTRALMDLIQNPTLIRSAGLNARQSALNYEWNYLIDRVEHIFATVTHNNSTVH